MSCVGEVESGGEVHGVGDVTVTVGGGRGMNVAECAVLQTEEHCRVISLFA